MTLPYTIQIPVYNETSALAFSSFYFDRLGVKARYVMDSQRTAQAAEAFHSLGHEPVTFSNDKPFIENGYENFAAVSPTDWILRVDCDEVPSLELLRACSDFVRQDRQGIAGFQRHQVLWREGRLLTATTDRFLPRAQTQWRLFNRQRVSFDRRIHTPGIHLEGLVEQSSEATIYHLSWIFLTPQARLEKSARYDANGQQPANRSNQLLQLNEVDWTHLDAPFLQAAFSEWERGQNRAPDTGKSTQVVSGQQENA